jgi:hypothetical protein
LFAAFIAIFTLQLFTGPSKGFDYHDAAIAGPTFFAILAFSVRIFKFRWWETLVPVAIPIALICVLPYSWVKIGIALAFACPIIIASIIAFYINLGKIRHAQENHRKRQSRLTSIDASDHHEGLE